MTARTAARLAWSIWTLTMALVAAGGAFAVVNRHVDRGPGDTIWVGIAFTLVSVAYATVGALVVSRQPRNPIGWLFAAMGLTAVGGFADGYAAYALLNRPGSLPGGVGMAWTADFFISSPGLLFGLFIFLFLLFPAGRLPSRRWRPIGWLAGAVIVLLQALTIFRPGPLGGFPSISNPLGLPVAGSAQVLDTVLFPLLLLLIAASAVSLIRRFRRAHGEERQQLKWFVTAAAFLAAVIASGPFWWIVVPAWGEPMWPFLFAAALITVPVSCGFAILRYRLYDIDVVINKTLVYGALAAFITAVYVGVVVGIGAAIGTGDQPNLALSIAATAMVAVAFQPVRERIQRLANRLVYGRRASPYETLAGFSERVAGTYAAEDVLPRMARILAEGTGARHASVWLRVGDQLRPSARWPTDEGGDEPLPLGGDEVPHVPGADITVAVRHRGEVLGALAVTKVSGEPLRPHEEALLRGLASQAGLVLSNLRLTEELRARLRDVSRLAQRLQESRRRIVATQDGERRRLERDIHDGAQQHLVALAVHLKLARTMADRDVEKARPLVAGLVRATNDALGELRDLARGIYPPLLEGEGIAAAIRAQAEKATVPVEVEAEGLHRYPPEMEAAAYFCILEALQNVAKYADATVARVRLRDEDGILRFEVRDDGKGFDPGSTSWGSGLTNMTDRVAALGGTVAVDSAPGEGTTVSGTIRVRHREPVG